tara:strand:+ start:534 stop:656 length:123 start_codon:yes stop_codon:yes gene_type:complete
MAEGLPEIRKTTISNCPYIFFYKTINSDILAKYFAYFFNN